jgi:hypothetical protein
MQINIKVKSLVEGRNQSRSIPIVKDRIYEATARAYCNVTGEIITVSIPELQMDCCLTEHIGLNVGCSHLEGKSLWQIVD